MKLTQRQRDEQTIQAFTSSQGKPIKTLWLLFKGYIWSLLGSVFFFLLKHSPTWIFPLAMANMINAVTNRDPNITRVIVYNVVFLIAILLLNIPLNYVHTWLYAKSVRQIEYDLRNAMVRKLQQLSIPYLRRTQSGRLQSKIMRDVEQVQTLSAQIFISILSILTGLVVSFVVVIARSREVFLFFMGTIPVAVFLVVAFKKRIQDDNQKFRQEMEATSARVMEMVEMIPVTRAHALENEETSRMEQQLSRMAQKGLRLDMVQTYFGSISWVAFQVFQVLCLGFTAWMAYQQRIGIGDITLYQTYFASIVSQIANLITLIPIIAKGLESVQSIGDILRAEDVEEQTAKEQLQQVKGDIKFEQVFFSYEKNEAPVLQDFTLHIHPGETIAFVGGSGSGKSTLMNLIIGFLKPSEGKIFVDGKDLATIYLGSYRRQISVVPQQSILFSGTVRENITYGCENISEEHLWEVIRGANLEDVISKLPEGLDTLVSEHGNNLSGGQKQRISIARAFVRNPSILLLDEATSALDSASERKIQDALENLSKGRTTLVVAHRLSTIRNADRIAVISGGKLSEIGSFDELMEKQGEFYRLYSLQGNA